MWDQIVGPQFRNVVSELIADPVSIEEKKETTEEATESDEDEKPNTDEDDYY
jgi:hypothetical protein